MPIRERDGKWHYRFQVDGAEYSANTGLVATERNRNAAMRSEAEARKLVLEGRGSELRLQVVRFSEAFERFLTWAATEYDRSSSVARLRTSFASLGTFFERTPVLQITAGLIDDYKAWRRAEHHVAEITIRHDLHALSKFFQYALRQNWARRNPVDDVDIPSDRHAVRIHVITEREERLYFAGCCDSPNLRDLTRIMLLQGCRPEELQNLAKSRVDLRAGTFRIAKDQGGKGYKGAKTEAGTRTLVMTPETHAILDRRMTSLGPWTFHGRTPHVPLTKLNCPHNRALARAEYLDLYERGLMTAEEIAPKINRTVKNVEKWALQHGFRFGADPKAQPFARFVIYDFRHTFATRAVIAGMSLPELARNLGHADLRSIDKYVHISDEMAGEAMRKHMGGMRPPKDEDLLNPLEGTIQ